MNNTTIGFYGICTGAAAVLFMGMGPLDPPPGPIGPTSPSLADLDLQLNSVQTQLNDILAQQATQNETSGPYDVFVWDLEEQHSNSIELIPGRVFIHSIHVTNNVALFFDGPGTATNNNSVRPLSGEMIGIGLAKSTVTNKVTLNLDIIVENGFHMSIFNYSGTQANDFVLVYYKSLP